MQIHIFIIFEAVYIYFSTTNNIVNINYWILFEHNNKLLDFIKLLPIA